MKLCIGVRAAALATTLPPPPESGVVRAATVASCVGCGEDYSRARFDALPSRRAWREFGLEFELADCSECGLPIAADMSEAGVPHKGGAQ